MRNIAIIMSLVMFTALASSPLAQARGPSGGWGAGNMQLANLTPDQQHRYETMRADFYSSMAPLRSEMILKQGELQTLAYDPQANQNKIASLSKEIGELQTHMVQKRAEFQNKIAKEIGFVPRGSGQGTGPMRGRM